MAALVSGGTAGGDPVALQLASRARGWFPQLASGPVSVRATRTRHQTWSRVVHYELRSGDGCAHVVTKQRSADAPRQDAHAAREALVPLPVNAQRLELEFEALAHIQRIFSSDGDPRFHVVRPLALLPEQRTLVLDDARCPSLAALLARGGEARTEAAVGHAGAWLRRLHEGGPVRGSAERPTSREAFAEGLRAGGLALVGLDPRRGEVARLAQRGEALARAHLPETLPLAALHGDFWPGNLLVGEGARVAAIDTFSAWRGAIHSDLAYFLNSLRLSNSRAYLRGWRPPARTVAALESRFLGGYFGLEPVPWRTLRLFEVQLLLHNWLRAARAAHVAPGRAKTGRRLRLALREPLYRRALAGLLRDAEAGERLSAI